MGYYTFQRNIKNIAQTNMLTKSIRKIFQDSQYPILIDEEGGRVSRLKNIVDSSIFTGNFLEIYISKI